MVIVVILAMQKPKTRADMMNFFFLRMLIWKIVIWVAAPMTNRTRKTALMGSSTFFVGKPPIPAVVGRYGGPLGGCITDWLAFVSTTEELNLLHLEPTFWMQLFRNWGFHNGSGEALSRESPDQDMALLWLLSHLPTMTFEDCKHDDASPYL
jgi:hypothetical protein